MRSLALALEREEEEVVMTRREGRQAGGERGQQEARLLGLETRLDKIISEDSNQYTDYVNSETNLKKTDKFNHKHLTKKMMLRWMEEEEERRGQLEDRVGQLQDQVKLLEEWKREGM